MSGFDKDWLALREPADRAARHKALVDRLVRHLQSTASPKLMDIGCGTGSTWRSLEADMPAEAAWLLLDNDGLLLQEAMRRIGPDRGVTVRQHDLNDIDGLPLDGVSIVTASALFDLCSEPFCAAFAQRLATAGSGLYAALNYDGIMDWSVTHPLDQKMVGYFNDHQRTDKGFGVALGPDATDCLAQVLSQQGYAVHIEDSPWLLDAASADLQQELLNGLRTPIVEMSGLPTDTVDEWLQFRLAAISAPGSSCRVGHKDLLALPD
ncbi:methyltransferase domain-containing protein [Rhizobium sp. RU36D]|uniref:methyltransferase domain-containing protein n=1 Tax=Rhizobium sp. RU36D TaxID=1907415 RepID=UPI0009D80F85|nr:methyltransferase domain-containing protein [Rhizobium sp. RU36D]SMC53091.1 hypothetical protein SAMN05880593_102238 [Rhizobium sp. RU36D]